MLRPVHWVVKDLYPNLLVTPPQCNFCIEVTPLFVKTASLVARNLAPGKGYSKELPLLLAQEVMLTPDERYQKWWKNTFTSWGMENMIPPRGTVEFDLEVGLRLIRVTGQEACLAWETPLPEALKIGGKYRTNNVSDPLQVVTILVIFINWATKVGLEIERVEGTG
jgi:hypothetical protein